MSWTKSHQLSIVYNPALFQDTLGMEDFFTPVISTFHGVWGAFNYCCSYNAVDINKVDSLVILREWNQAIKALCLRRIVPGCIWPFRVLRRTFISSLNTANHCMRDQWNNSPVIKLFTLHLHHKIQTSILIFLLINVYSHTHVFTICQLFYFFRHQKVL